MQEATISKTALPLFVLKTTTLYSFGGKTHQISVISVCFIGSEYMCEMFHIITPGLSRWWKDVILAYSQLMKGKPIWRRASSGGVLARSLAAIASLWLWVKGWLHVFIKQFFSSLMTLTLRKGLVWLMKKKPRDLWMRLVKIQGLL